MSLYQHKSKMARRLVRLFVVLTAVPLIITTIIMGRIGRDQTVWTANTMRLINRNALASAGHTFQQIGHEAIQDSSKEAENASTRAIGAVSNKVTDLQATSLAQTAKEFSTLASSSFNDAMSKSLATHRATLGDIRDQMAGKLALSARDTQRQAAGNIERAMLSLNDTLMRERVQRLTDLLRNQIEDAPRFLSFTAQMLDMRPGHAQGQKETLDALVRRIPEFLVVSVMDTHGKETAMSASDWLVTDADLGSHPSADYFRAAIRGETFISHTSETTPAGAPVLRFAVPIEAYRGKIVGVLAARYSLEDLWDEIRNTRIGQTGFAYVLDQKGHPLLAPRTMPQAVLSSQETLEGLRWRVVAVVPRAEAMRPIQALKADIAQGSQRALDQMRQAIDSDAAHAAAKLALASSSIRNQTVQRMQARWKQALQSVRGRISQQTRDQLVQMERTIQAQTARTQNDSDQQMEHATESASRRLEVRGESLTNQTLQQVGRHLFILSLLITAISCAFGGLAALLTAGRIVRPVTRLAQVTQAISSGELDKRIDENAPDEIGDLAIAFNKMAASLQQSRADLNEAEGQLVQSAKLASLGTLSAGVAHELNQPLAIIRGITQQLAVEEGMSEDIKADLELIEGQTTRMIKIIRHLRTFCRTAGEEFARIDVNQVVQDCFILVGAQLRAHNIAVALELCESAPSVLGDANELEQVFLNLITNARDALEGRTDACITIRSYVDSNRLILEFRDNGTGIPEAVMDHIFDPFFTTKEPGKGTGLGLSISHSILKRHNGQIQVHNDPGAVFTIVLPIAEEQQDVNKQAA